MSGFYTGPNIVVIGGGTGLSVILRGIKQITPNLTAVVSVADDGGSSGFLREDLGMLPPGDIRSCIVALADEENEMQRLLQYRFEEGMLAGQNFGNLLIAAMDRIYGNFEKAVEKTNEILRVTGRVLPVTSADVQLCATLKNGETVCGESKIPAAVLQSKSPIDKVYLDPALPKPVEGAIEAIENADMIIIGPGSLYTSIIPNLLVDGIGEAIIKSSAMKMHICNVMTQPGETDDFSVYQHVSTVIDYLGKNVLDYVVVNNAVAPEETLRRYTADGSYQMLLCREDRKKLEALDITIVENMFLDVKLGYIRHDAERIASIILNLIHS